MVDTNMPTTIYPAAPVAHVSAIFLALVSAIPMVLVFVTLAVPVPAISIAPTLTGPGVFLSPISFFTSSL